MIGENNPINKLSEEEFNTKLQNWKRKMQPYWNDPAWVIAHLEKAQRSPNKFERRIFRFLHERGLPFEITGHWKFWVGPTPSGRCRNPDFIHESCRTKGNGNKLAILAHGLYWHKDEELNKQEIADYEIMGWRVFVIWENEELDDAMEQRIKQFIGSRSKVLKS